MHNYSWVEVKKKKSNKSILYTYKTFFFRLRKLPEYYCTEYCTVPKNAEMNKKQHKYL